MQGVTTIQKRYRKEIDIQFPGQVYGRNLRVVKAIVFKLKNEMEKYGKEINPWIDTREVPGKAVVYAEREYVLNRIVKALKEREQYVIERQRHYAQTNINREQERKEMEREMDVITAVIADTVQKSSELTEEDYEVMRQYEEDEENKRLWSMATQWGMEDQFDLYDEQKNPYGVYLCTNELKIGEVFNIPCQIFT